MNAIEQIVKNQREYFNAGNTLQVASRIKYLKALKADIISHEKEIFEALKSDLNKSASESYMVEVGMILEELTFIIKRVKKWAKQRRAQSPLAQFPSKSYELFSPYGVTLIIAPWNYPFLLTMQPLVGAIAAGNTAVVKPSRASANTSRVMKEIIERVFPAEYVSCIYGEDANQEVLECKFDYIFFTGGAEVGKKVYTAASKNLTPVTLELGGKSPVVVDETAKIDLAAKRIVFGKLLNAGQTCIAPDYVVAHKSVAEGLVESMKKQIEKLYPDALKCEYFGKIISERHFNRVKGLIDGNVYCGGGFDEHTQKIEPTIIYPATLADKAMQEEIFGPVLPVLTYSDEKELFDILDAHPTPLAFYLFTQSKKREKKFMRNCLFGGGCVNDVIMHIATSRMAFGGVGTSGIGSYHGKNSFVTFSHSKAILKKSTLIDLPIRYTPYSNSKDKLVRFFLK
ncbi:MAG: aldehyde dehydrogenase [Clostridiales bacterium]|nr:aldehyde dehydrogenase [Clostridiales bacterium]